MRGAVPDASPSLARLLAGADVRQGLLDAWSGIDAQARGVLARGAWLLVLLVSVGGVAISGAMLHRSWAALRHAQAEEVRPRPVRAAPRAASEPEGDFVAELPAIAPSDAQIRHAGKLAESLHLVVAQMQADARSSAPHGLAQVRLAIQLRGDYRDLKAFVASMLEKYPGLTLEKLSITHGASADEASVELVQYLRAR